MKRWKQERPSWCGNKGFCTFIRRAQDAICCGRLLIPQDHGKVKAINTHILCINPEGNDGNIKFGKHIFDLEIAIHDCDVFRWILDAIDGEKTSWRSML